MAKLLLGKEVAAAMRLSMRESVEALSVCGVTPTLAIVRVGENGDDVAYEKSAAKRCADVGVAVSVHAPGADVSQEELISLLTALGSDSGVHGILLMRPLPKGMDDHRVCAAIPAEKDVDGVTDASLGFVFSGSGAGFAPCTAEACVRMLTHYEIPLAGKRAVVVGRSMVVGKPLSMLLLSQNATVTVCHSKTENLSEMVREADVVLAAVGRASFLKRECFRSGQTVVDVGINVSSDGKLVGDVAFSEVEPIVSAITPVPGGVGAVTASVLAEHVIRAARRQAGI